MKTSENAKLNEVNLYLEATKRDMLDFNIVETDGPYQSKELLQGMSRNEYVSNMMQKGNYQSLSEIYFEELRGLDEILVMTVANRLHCEYSGREGSIRSVHIMCGKDSFHDMYTIKNYLEGFKLFSFTQLQEALRFFRISMNAAVRQTKDEREDMICAIVRKWKF